MSCEFIERFLDGDEEAIKRVPEAAVLMVIARETRRNPQLGPLVFGAVRPMLMMLLESPQEERRVIGAIMVAHVFAYLIPPPLIAPLIERAYLVLDRIYDRCRIEDLAIFLAEAAMHKAVLLTHPKSYSTARALFKKAEGILLKLSDGSKRFYRSIGYLYLRRADGSIRVARFKEAIAIAKKALESLKKSGDEALKLVAYDKFIRAYYLAGSEKYEKFIEALVSEFVRHPIVVRFVALDYVLTGDERLYELLPEGSLDPVVLIARIKQSSLGRDVAMKKLGMLARNRDPFISLLARISLADLDVNTQRIIRELKRSIMMAIQVGYLDLAWRAVRVGEKKGVPESELNDRRKMIREAYKRG